MTWPHAFSGERRVPLRTFARPFQKPPAILRTRIRAPRSSAPKEPAPDLSTPTARVLAEVAAKHRIGVGDVKAGSRFAEHVVARQEAMHRLRADLGLSTVQIARALGLKDHTTVLHGLRRHAERQGRAG